jgi:hypothetical protein
MLIRGKKKRFGALYGLSYKINQFKNKDHGNK